MIHTDGRPTIANGRSAGSKVGGLAHCRELLAAEMRKANDLELQLIELEANLSLVTAERNRSNDERKAYKQAFDSAYVALLMIHRELSDPIHEGGLAAQVELWAGANHRRTLSETAGE